MRLHGIYAFFRYQLQFFSPIEMGGLLAPDRQNRSIRTVGFNYGSCRSCFV